MTFPPELTGPVQQVGEMAAAVNLGIPAGAPTLGQGPEDWEAEVTACPAPFEAGTHRPYRPAAPQQKYPVLVEDCFADLADILHVVHQARAGRGPDARRWFATRV